MDGEKRPKAAMAAIISAWCGIIMVVLVLIGWSSWREDFMLNFRQSVASWLEPDRPDVEAGDYGEQRFRGVWIGPRSNNSFEKYVAMLCLREGPQIDGRGYDLCSLFRQTRPVGKPETIGGSTAGGTTGGTTVGRGGGGGGTDLGTGGRGADLGKSARSDTGGANAGFDTGSANRER